MTARHVIEFNFASIEALKKLYDKEISKLALTFFYNLELPKESQFTLRLQVDGYQDLPELTGSVIYTQAIAEDRFSIGFDLSATEKSSREKLAELLQKVAGEEKADTEPTVSIPYKTLKALGLLESADDGPAPRPGAEGGAALDRTRIQEAKKLFTLARENIARGNLNAALPNLRRAASLDSGQKQYRAVLREVERKVMQANKMKSGKKKTK